MRKLMLIIPVRMLLGFWLVLSFGFLVNIEILKAEDATTVEGVWEIKSSWDGMDIGSRYAITHEDGGYHVVMTAKDEAASEGINSDFVYYGSPTQVTVMEILSYNDLLRMFSQLIAENSPLGRAVRAALPQLGDKITIRHQITAFPDGRSAEHAEDGILLYFDGNGQLARYEITPLNHTLTLARVSGPAKVEAPAVAQVESRGEFYFLTKDGRKVSVDEASKIPLEEGTKVVTGKDGHVKMTLPDNTTFTVGPGSDIVIDEFVYDPDKSPKKVIATMTIGVFRWVTGKVFGGAEVYNDPRQRKLNLPVVAVGIRGTDFEATVEPNGSGSVVLNFGQLEITEKKTGFTFMLNAGEKITFGADGPVSRPIKIQ